MNKCKNCGEILLTKELDKHLKTCPHCGYHFTLSAQERIQCTLDEDSFEEFVWHLQTEDPLHFPDYLTKLKKVQEATGLEEGLVAGVGTIEGHHVVIAVMDANFIMGSMGSVVGEKLTRTVEEAIKLRYPLMIFSVSGGARMQEAIFSLMQMAKVSAALAKMAAEQLFYISVLTNPTTGGVTASFAMQGDLNVAEPGAIVGFAGRRVIEQTIRQKLPDEFQTSEFVLEHGMLDQVVHRKDLKSFLAIALSLHEQGGAGNGHGTAV